MSLRRALYAALASLFVVSFLSGCGTTGRVVDNSVEVSPQAMATAKSFVTHVKAALEIQFRLSQAAVKECLDPEDSYRPAFSLMFNPSGIKDDGVRAAIYRLTGANEYPVIIPHTPELSQFAGKRIKVIGDRGAQELYKSYMDLWEKAKSNEPTDVTFEDGTKVGVKPVRGCYSFIEYGHMGKLSGALNIGLFVETAPEEWIMLPESDAERAFVIGRSLYFTGAEGRDKLHNVFLMGAVPSAALRLFMLGLGNLIVDPKLAAVVARRSLNKGEADAFAVKAMALAGFDPGAAVRFAQRSMKDAEWPSAADELKFDEERLQVLADQVASLDAARLTQQAMVPSTPPNSPKPTDQPEPKSLELQVEKTRFIGTFALDAESKTYSGTGKVIWKNGDHYDGQMIKGLRQGKGRMTWSDGQTYDGDWRGNEPEGHGKLKFANGDLYEGQVRHGVPHGRGTMRYRSGDLYSGNLIAGVPDGTGTYQWSNGDHYNGEWSRGRMEGKGAFSWRSGDRWVDIFRNGERTSDGTLIEKQSDAAISMEPKAQ